MLALKKSIGLTLAFATLMAAIILVTDSANAAGISIDAGLTPAENRWIFRTQMRYMERENAPGRELPEMTSYMFPVVVAYGLRSDFTVMVRQVIRRSEMIMGGRSSSSNGLNDILLLGKFRLARVNTSSYTLGVAPTLGVEFPSGNKNFSSESWDMHLGCFVSGRMRSFGIDLNAGYVWNGMALSGGEDVNPGDEFSFEGALAHQFSFGQDANFALAPVIESSYRTISSDTNAGNAVANTGESVFLLSPGIKVTWSSFILEGLIQIPVWQAQNGLQTERAPGFLVGIRLMS